MTAQAPANVVLRRLSFSVLLLSVRELIAALPEGQYEPQIEMVVDAINAIYDDRDGVPLFPAPLTAAPALDREALILAIHNALGGNGWAYSNYGNDELVDCRDKLEAAANAILDALSGPLQAEGVPPDRTFALYVPMPLNADGDGPADEADTVRVEHQVWDAETNGTICTAFSAADAVWLASLINATTPAAQPDFSDLRALAERATPGEWQEVTNMSGPMLVTHKDGKDYICALHIGAHEHANAAYIAAANPARILALLDALEGRE